jgi:hypothetical protein
MRQAKRVGKVLQAVPDSRHWLVCNTDMAELNLVGIVARDEKISNSIGIRFRTGDAQVFVVGEQVCKIVDGEFVAAGSDIGLDKLRDALIASVGEPCDSLCQLVSAISDRAIQTRHGCTVVLDFGEPIAELSGQRLVTPLTLSDGEDSLSIAAAMSSIDGALHIDKDCQLRAFGCLLDGASVEGEKLDRGARYNSALRFAKRTDITVVAVVVSEDGLLSVFGRDGEYSGERQLVSLHYIIPAIPLAEWLENNPAQ